MLASLTSTGAAVGSTLAGVAVIVLGWRQLVRLRTPKAQRHFDSVETLRQDFDVMKDHYEQELELVREKHNNEIGELRAQHQDCERRHAKLEGQIDVLKSDLVRSVATSVAREVAAEMRKSS